MQYGEFEILQIRIFDYSDIKTDDSDYKKNYEGDYSSSLQKIKLR